MKGKKELKNPRDKAKKKKPKFRRQEWSRKKSLGEKWRKPRGLHSKLRMHQKAKGAFPKPGYGSPSEVRGLNREGYREVVVSNAKELEKVNPEKEIAVIARGVGRKKRFEIMESAGKKNIKVGNYKF